MIPQGGEFIRERQYGRSVPGKNEAGSGTRGLFFPLDKVGQ
jgi:hypothetical protein